LTKHQFIDLVNAPERSDEELFELFLKNRDRSILAGLFRKYMPLVFGVCMKYLKDKVKAQDCTMEIFERLIDLDSNHHIQRFKPYLFVLTKNYCLMKLRGEKAQFVEISASDMEIAEEVHPIDENDLKMDALERCIAELKDLQKTCIKGFYLEKKSYLQLSKEFKVTLNAVKSHIQNGKRNLKSCLEAK
jgi:RNA polymerase sigma-70 factor (ECF subfamily)